jgi:hypothetical protein
MHVKSLRLRGWDHKLHGLEIHWDGSQGPLSGHAVTQTDRKTDTNQKTNSKAVKAPLHEEP